MFVNGPKQTSSISPEMEISKLEIKDYYHIFRATDDTEGANQPVGRNFVACLETFYHTITSSRQSEEPKKISVGIFEYILASMLNVFLNM